MIEVRQAALDEVEIACNILQEAARWIAERGEPLWPMHILQPEDFYPVAQRGELFLAWLEGEAVGTITYQPEDKIFWPEVPEGDSAFFHKVAVRRKVAGQGVAKVMIEWAIDKAKASGKKYLRMDTAHERPKLRGFYEDLGFQYVDSFYAKVSGFHIARYELPLLPL